MPNEKMPVFQGTERQKVTKIIDWLFKKIKLRMYSPAEFEEKFFSRSPEQIIKEGHCCYRFPCFDLSSVAAELLLANGFKPTLALEKHCDRGEFGVHLTTEFLLGGMPSHLKITRAAIKLSPGTIENSTKRRVIKRITINKSQFSTPYLHLFGVKNMKELKSYVGAEYLGLLEGKMHRINSKTSRLGAMLRRARFRTGRAIKNLAVRPK